ncbi:MAG: alpha/beta fold hydrolase [Dechloromonas sp.]|uniref:Alpha/beta fold hydrolase n=1 Tax=Candidatus Dechloromonas phosphorivorans TaxID=2899244 RepID=A0A935JV45_9RHOO|nr:alpha/beta fold hydrolase [Candidatus Dechloromonas phosphorivorans]
MRRAHCRLAAAFCLVLVLTGCASISGVTTSSLDGRNVEHIVAGHGTPAVVFENGLGGRLQWWAEVLPAIAQETTVFAYNRAGTGTSAETSAPRDGDAITEELRRNLRDKGIAPPYVLVGHSLGGLYMQFYARRYPEDVAGLVLVDSTHPEQLKGAGAKDNWPTWLKLMFDVSLSSAASKELAALPATGAAMLALPPLTGKPVVVLSAQKPMSETSELARDANAKRSEIVHLHPGAKQVWVDSGHAIPLEQPEAVIFAIHEVLHSVQAAKSNSLSTVGNEIRQIQK